MSTDLPVVLVTGSSRGIGRYLIEHYASRGSLVIGCSRSEVSYGASNAMHIVADISCESDVQSLFATIRSAVGRLDVIINNAGIASMNHSLLTPGKTASKVVDVNLLGTFYVCREGARLLMKSKRARIVNFSTVAAAMDLEGEAIYAASKSGVESLTRVLAKEFGAFGITVNAIGPTPVETDLIKSVPKSKIESLIGNQAIKRMGTFEDVKNVVDFFISECSGFVSGQVIYLGGVFK